MTCRAVAPVLHRSQGNHKTRGDDQQLDLGQLSLAAQQMFLVAGLHQFVDQSGGCYKGHWQAGVGKTWGSLKCVILSSFEGAQ